MLPTSFLEGLITQARKSLWCFLTLGLAPRCPGSGSYSQLSGVGGGSGLPSGMPVQPHPHFQAMANG